MNQFQNSDKKKHFKHQIRSQAIQVQHKIIYFRCADKRTFVYEIGKGDDINAIKSELVSALKCQFLQIIFIYKGKEVFCNQQLQQLPTKTILHVVNLKNAASQSISITINFFGQFKESFEVSPEMKIYVFMNQIKSKIGKFIAQQLVLINVGKVMNFSKNFREEFVENGTQLYAAKAIKQTFLPKRMINSSNPKIQTLIKNDIQQLKTNLCSNSQQLPLTKVELLLNNTLSQQNYKSKAQNTKNQPQIIQKQAIKKKTNSLEIPISTVFNVHESFEVTLLTASKPITQKINQKIQNQVQKFDFLSVKAKERQLKLIPQDFLYYNIQNMPETDFFFKNSLLLLKQTIKKHK